MINRMNRPRFRIVGTPLVALMLLAFGVGATHVTPAASSIAVEKGLFIGAKEAVHPSWFKASFLDFSEDIDEASAQGKRLALYFWQDGCPYCNQLWEHNMAVDNIETKFRDNFDVVAINIWGDEEVISVGGKVYSEKQLSEALDVNYTPTLIFYTEAKKPALRLNGYYPPQEFDAALDYVRTKQESVQSFATHRADIERITSVGLPLENTQDYFKPLTELSYLLGATRKQAMAVLFESPNCAPCNTFHQKTLADEATTGLLQQMDVVQLNVLNQQQMHEINGEKITASQWAKKLDIAYYPSLVFFNEQGEYIMQIDSSLRTFHVQSVFAYVVEGAYLEEPNFQRYISDRAEALREQGVDVDIWRY
jgi:thioredoxin-related protein